MTCIATMMTGPLVAQASDRLVSAGTKAWDPASNKVVVALVRDALVVIGYSGLAYLGQETTDQVIAEVVSGVDLGVGPSPASTHGHRDRRGIGLIALQLCRRLDTEFSRLPPGLRDYRQEIVVAGYQVRAIGRGSGVRAFVWIVFRGADGKFCVEWRHRGKASLFGTPRGMIRTPEARQAIARIAEAADVSDLEAASQTTLIGLVRSISDRETALLRETVGRNCMWVSVPRPIDQPRVTVRYEPDDRAPLLSTYGSFAPYLIAPGIVLGPSEYTPLPGGGGMSVGALEVTYEGPLAGPPNVVWAWSSQRRRRYGVAAAIDQVLADSKTLA